MSVPAWIFMFLVWSVILTMVGYCFFKILTTGRKLAADDPPPLAPPPSPPPSDTGITDHLG